VPKELRISAVVEVPDDIWQQADTLSAAKPVVEAFTEAVQKMGGRVEAELVTPKPRADKGDPAAQYVAAGGKLPA
jgi:hypothetical protein